MDWVILGFIALQALAIAGLAGLVIARGRALGGVAAGLREVDPELRAGTGSGDDLADGVRRLVRRAQDAEYALAQRLRDLAYLADLIGVGVVRLTDDLRVEVANTAAHVFLERAPGEMLGRTAMEALGDHRVEALAREAAQRGAASGEVALREPDGPTLIVRARRSPILGIWMVLEDVAELRRLQRIRAEFIDNLSHELRTPITTVGLLAETLTRDAEAAGDAIPARMRDRIAKLALETDAIAEMVTELLDLARIESGGRQLHLDDVDLGRVAAGSVERLRPFAERQGIRLASVLAGDIPLIRGDGPRLEQVFSNLIHNAVKFSPPRSTVTVTVSTTDGEVEASVADQGVGIAAVDLPRIFERFYKADRSRSAGGGTGLGLAIARHIVDGHGGRLGVRSEEGAGATFTMTFPTPDHAATDHAPAEGA
ncbi:MAG: Histidine kinase protein [Chloroflexi bacterium]|nr:Histidine kinase protein [Chloroflexota bacterium]